MLAKILGALSAFFTIVATWVVWFSLEWLVFNSCDPKLGCFGGVQFAFFFSAVAGLLSCLSFCVLVFWPWRQRMFLDAKHQIKVGLIGGLLLSLVLVSVPYWNMDTYDLISVWFGVSLIAFNLTFRLPGRLSKK